jgi:hypothetical protein
MTENTNALAAELAAIEATVELFHPDARMAARSLFEAQERVYGLLPRILAALAPAPTAGFAEGVEAAETAWNAFNGGFGNFDKQTFMAGYRAGLANTALATSAPACEICGGEPCFELETGETIPCPGCTPAPAGDALREALIKIRRTIRRNLNIETRVGMIDEIATAALAELGEG